MISINISALDLLGVLCFKLLSVTTNTSADLPRHPLCHTSSNPGRVKDILRLAEHIIHLFQRTTICFGKEEIHRRDGSGINDRVYYVVAVLDGREPDRCDLRDNKIEEPRRRCCDAADSRAQVQRSDLSGVQKGKTQESDGEDDVEEK